MAVLDAFWSLHSGSPTTSYHVFTVALYLLHPLTFSILAHRHLSLASSCDQRWRRAQALASWTSSHIRTMEQWEAPFVFHRPRHHWARHPLQSDSRDERSLSFYRNYEHKTATAKRAMIKWCIEQAFADISLDASLEKWTTSGQSWNP